MLPVCENPQCIQQFLLLFSLFIIEHFSEASKEKFEDSTFAAKHSGKSPVDAENSKECISDAGSPSNPLERPAEAKTFNSVEVGIS